MLKHYTKICSFVLTALLLAVCGTPAPAPTAETNPAAGTTSVQFPITVKHDGGQTTIPAMPQRIVTIGDESTELALPLGIQPVGVAGRMQSGIVGGKLTDPSYYDAAQLGQPTFVGDVTAPNLEAIAVLQPDLILYNNYDEQIRESLSQIAPTLGFDLGEKRAWKTAFVEVGRVFNREARAEQVVSDFNAQLEVLRKRLAPVAAESPNVTLLYLPEPQTTFVLGEEFALGGLLSDLGFTVVPPNGVQLENGIATISPEALADLDTDAILTLRINNGGELERYPAEEILDSLGISVLRYVINPEQPYTGPISEPAYLQNFAELLGGGQE